MWTPENCVFSVMLGILQDHPCRWIELKFFTLIWRRGWSQQIPSMIEKTISGVRVFPGSAETLVRTGEITNHHSIAYSLSNVSAKNYRNRLMCVEVIVCNISVVFWDTVHIPVCGVGFRPDGLRRHGNTDIQWSSQCTGWCRIHWSTNYIYDNQPHRQVIHVVVR